MVAHTRLTAAIMAITLTSLAGISARANSVTIDTGVANWQYVSTTSYVVNGGNDPAAPGAASVITTPNIGWLPDSTVNNAAISAGAELTPNAQWIGTRTTGDSVGYYGDFVFSLTLSYSNFSSSPGSPPEGFLVSGVVSADNELTSFYVQDSAGIHPLFINPTPLVDGAPGNSAAYGFQRVFDANGVNGLFDPFTLIAVVHNDFPASAGPDPITGKNESPENPANPFGFIIAGTVTTFGGGTGGNPVPLPASVGVGFSMLGGFGAMFAFRKRLSRRSRIVV